MEALTCIRLLYIIVTILVKALHLLLLTEVNDYFSVKIVNKALLVD